MTFSVLAAVAAGVIAPSTTGASASARRKMLLLDGRTGDGACRARG
jgi:hypothetical protein